MTEWKNSRYTGAPTGQFQWFLDDANNARSLRTEQGGFILSSDSDYESSYSWIEIEFLNNKDWSLEKETIIEGTKNLLADAAINAEKAEHVDELEAENARLRQRETHLECVLSVRNTEISGLKRALEQDAAEIAALKAKYTPCPMSEAPRDGNCYLVVDLRHYKVGIRRENLTELHKMQDLNIVNIHSNPLIVGYLPADTFKGGQ